MASEVLITISKDEKERFRLLSEEKYLLDTQSNLSYARQQAEAKGLAKGEARGMKKGLAEGRAEGRAEGNTEKALEIARKMKQAERPFSEIAEFTGLSPKTIQNL